MPTAERFISSFNRPNLTYRVVPKRRSFQRLTTLLRDLRDGSAIIYRFSRKDTEDLASRLSGEGFRALPYHAGLEDDVRRRTQERFISGDVPIIVATIAFGMGIDKPDIRLVVHYDLPKTIEGYYQETGRAGRDGLPSDCVLFFTLADKSKQEYFIRQIEDTSERNAARERLARVVEYGSGNSCRRADTCWPTSASNLTGTTAAPATSAWPTRPQPPPEPPTTAPQPPRRSSQRSSAPASASEPATSWTCCVAAGPNASSNWATTSSPSTASPVACPRTSWSTWSTSSLKGASSPEPRESSPPCPSPSQAGNSSATANP